MSVGETLRLYDDATLSLLQRANLLVAAWRNDPTLAQMLVIAKHIERWRETFGEEVAFVNVIGGNVESLSKEARTEANRITARYPNNLCSAHVVLIGGLAGGLARTILRAMALVGRHQSPWRVFDNNRTAAEWVAGHLHGRANQRWETADVLSVLNQAMIIQR